MAHFTPRLSQYNSSRSCRTNVNLSGYTHFGQIICKLKIPFYLNSYTSIVKHYLEKGINSHLCFKDVVCWYVLVNFQCYWISRTSVVCLSATRNKLYLSLSSF